MCCLFIGNLIPYHITQPNNDIQIVSPTATMFNLMCSLNVSIPSGILVTWLHNGNVVIRLTTQIRLANTLILSLINFEPSAAGVYQCVLNDTVIGRTLRRSITLFITGAFVYDVSTTAS